MRGGNRTRTIALVLFFYLPVVWAALIVAQSQGGGLAELLEGVTAAMKHPFDVHWKERSLRTVLTFTGLYAVVISAVLSTRGNTREGEEHGSAHWGNPKQVNAMFAQKQNKLLTRHVRLGLDTHKHRRSLNVLVMECYHERRVVKHPKE